MRIERSGVTRVVLIGRRWAIKRPRLSYACGVRGWLANRSEWRQRHRPDVARPVATIGHVILVMPAADRVATEGQVGPWCDRDGDEGKPSSWGHYPSEGWLLIDYDRAWHREDRGLVGKLYYGRQEWLARRWSAL